ncbi:MAG: hypothetical protein CL613_06415 [Aquimarina sp.]|nr:hypothetical protein [Aquimarina sp.]
MKIIKKHFTITEIGSIRFYIGLVLGAGYAIILNLLLQLFRKTFHFVNVDYGITLTNLNYQTLSFYDSFFNGLLATSLAFCITTYYWMNKPVIKNRNTKSRIRFAQTNAIFMFSYILMFLSRVYLMYFSSNFNSTYYSIQEYFGYSVYTLPLFIFLFNWVYISKVYKSFRIVGISTLIFICVGYLLNLIKL